MPDLFSLVLWPFKWVIEAILVGFHSFWTAIGFAGGDGLTWVLSILGLVLVVRAALIPLFVKQIKSQRKMLEIAPHLKKIQEKYKGKRDQFSREAMSRETMELYRKTGTSPFSSCLPLLAQMPIFFSLFQVLETAQRDPGRGGVGLLSVQLAQSFGNSALFGAPLHETIGTGVNALGRGGTSGDVLVVVIGIFMVAAMTVTQFITQKQIMSKNVSKETMESPMYRQQKLLLYVLPLVFIFSGIAFPLGVMFYWVFSNLWTMGQQFIVIRNSPTPGSEAAKAREVRLAKKAARKQLASGGEGSDGTAAPVEAKPRVNTQRVQPVGRSRAKRAGGAGGRA
ncbi:membrane protein insertase YidC [Amnibacterium endophyticum]|uniref:Membrane protein insertase YidC n=1 Tax=Amnibacterium endophyticum TaxID=2109337 RepID=A0ABW4LAD5_9MICO